MRVKHGFRYLLRLINANVHDCPILLSAHGHSLQILAADGNPVQSMTGTRVVLFPGTFYVFHVALPPTLSLYYNNTSKFIARTHARILHTCDT